MTAYDRLLAALDSHGSRVTGSGRQRKAQCPAHDDQAPSLSVTQGEDRVLVKCHAGCDTDDVLAVLHLASADLFDEPRQNGNGRRKDAEYNYTDESSKLLFQVVRFEPKDFRQRRPDGAGGWTWSLGDTRRVLYRLPAVLKAAESGETVYVVEGEKDVHAVEAAGAVATTNPQGAGKWRDEYAEALVGARVIIVADCDGPGRAHARKVHESLSARGLPARIVEPVTGKDVTEHLAAGHSLAEFVAADGSVSAPEPITLTEAREVFLRWFGDKYDLDALDATLATAATERLGDGDPPWLLIISGSGNAKTETVQALNGIGATITSTIASQGALLSATPKKDTSKDATGGLLRKIGDRGVLVIKDVTSILSMGRDMRAEVLGALREVHDGSWSRNVGTDGGRTLDWAGRIVIIGAVTTAWDQAHAVIASMGDRFVLLRMDSTSGRRFAGRRAIGNTGAETQMRAELAAAVAGVMAGMRHVDATLSETETDLILAAADIVTLARTGVEYDYRGDVIDAHAPEMPTRFAKQLTQVVRGAVAIGIDRPDALRLAIRCARDSMPPMRLAIIDDVAVNPASTTADVRKRIGKPRSTVDRQLQALHMLGVLDCEEEEGTWNGRPSTKWRYTLAAHIDPDALNTKSVPDLSVPVYRGADADGEVDDPFLDAYVPTDISGTDFPARVDYAGLLACIDCGADLAGPPTAGCASREDHGQVA